MKQDYLKNNNKEQMKKEEAGHSIKRKEEKSPGYGDKKLEGPDRPQN